MSERCSQCEFILPSSMYSTNKVEISIAYLVESIFACLFVFVVFGRKYPHFLTLVERGVHFVVYFSHRVWIRT